MLFRRLLPGLPVVAVAAALFAHPAAAEGSCTSDNSCARKISHVSRHGTAPHYVWDKRTRKWVASYRHRSGVMLARASQGSRGHIRLARGERVLPAARQHVIALIKSMAPGYGVPTWFALRIAKVESGYNPRARGLAGEYGVFQLKCSTARGIGYRGGCRGLLDAATNVRMGLKHLSMAVRSSHGNLKLAASKHNGGLGRKRLVRSYVRMVF